MSLRKVKKKARSATIAFPPFCLTESRMLKTGHTRGDEDMIENLTSKQINDRFGSQANTHTQAYVLENNATLHMRKAVYSTTIWSVTGCVENTVAMVACCRGF